MLSPLELISVLLTLTAIFSWVNERFFKLPETIGVLIMGLLASILLLVVELVFHEVALYEDLARVVRQVDFQRTVLDGMLAFLLFAGALHVDFSALRDRAWIIAAMASLGVALSTLLVGTGIWLAGQAIGTPLPFIWALVFGALISPTDPVAVLATLKSVKVPQSLEADMSGESLFNDGIGVVVFTIVLTIATGEGHSAAGFSGAANLLALEAFGGAAVGLVGGYIAFLAMQRIDNYSIEVLISLALVAGIYALASRFGMSGPIAVVVAGLFIGNRGPKRAMSDLTQRYLFGFWTLIDEILNAILFLLIGLEVLVLRLDPSLSLLPLAAIPIALLARWVAVSVPVLILSRTKHFVSGTIATLTWGGLKGGISVALALSIPEGEYKSIILAATYTVVIFTIIVQGLTLRRLVQRVVT